MNVPLGLVYSRVVALLQGDGVVQADEKVNLLDRLVELRRTVIELNLQGVEIQTWEVVAYADVACELLEADGHSLGVGTLVWVMGSPEAHQTASTLVDDYVQRAFDTLGVIFNDVL